MPDMRTAFSNAFHRAPDIQKAIAEWEDTEAQPIKIQEKQVASTTEAQPITISEATYNYIKQNPHSSRQQILDGMAAKGFNAASVTTMLSQGRMCNLIRKESTGGYTVVHNTFVPTTVKMLKQARKVKQKAKREVTIGIAALKHQAKVQTPQFETVAIVSSNTPIIAPKETAPVTDIDTLLNSLTFNQAIGLYKKLKTMLGEV